MGKAQKELTALYNAGRRGNMGLVKGVDQLSAISDKAFGAFAKGAGLAAAGVAGIAAASDMVGSSFEEQMGAVQAISGASAADMRRLTGLAEEMGRTTSFSATEAGEGLEYMAMAGWGVDDMMAGLPGIMDLAAASGEELGAASDIVTDALTSFGYQASDASMFADVLAQASSKSNTNVAMMGETFNQVAPIAGSFGYSVQDMAVGIGLMANAGIKAERSGTSLKNLLTNLAKPTAQMKGYMDKLGFSLTDGHGKMKDFSTQMQELREGFAGLTEARRAEYAAGIAGKEGMAGLLAIVNASDKDFLELTEAINQSSGAAKRMADTRLDNLKGDLTLLKSAAEGAGIGIYNGLSWPLRELAKMATAWVQSFTDSGWMEQFTTEGIPTIRRNLLQLGKSFEPLLNVGKWFVKNPKAISSSLMGIGAALLTFKAAKGITTAVKGLGALSGIMGAWPVMAAGAVIGAITGIGTAIAQAEKEAVRANLAEHFGSITLSMEELDEAARHIVGSDLLDGIDSFGEASDKTSGIYKSLKSNVDEINKANWKIKLGIELTQEEEESYAAAVDEYVRNAQDYITSQGYEFELAVDVVFGSGDQAGEGLKAGNNAFVQSLMSQLGGNEAELSGIMQQLLEGSIDGVEAQELAGKYMAKISEVTQLMTDANNAAKLQMIEGQYMGLESLSPDTFMNLQQSINEYTDEALAGIDESQQKVFAGLNAQRMSGQISDGEFEDQSANMMREYYQRKAEAIKNGQEAMKNAIMNTYGDEITPALEQMDAAIQAEVEKLHERGKEALTGEDWSYIMESVGASIANSTDLSSEAKGAIQMLLEGMKPGQEELAMLAEQYKNSGLEAGGAAQDEFLQGLAQSFGEATNLEALTGSTDAIYATLGSSIADSPELATVISATEQTSGRIPDGLIRGIASKNRNVADAGKELLDYAKSQMEAIGIDANVPVRVTLDMVTAGVNTGKLTIPNMPGAKITTPGFRAEGGIVTEPELSWIAEAGYPESVIPLDGSKRSMELWKETGRLMGAYEAADYGRIGGSIDQAMAVQNSHSQAMPASPVFSPTVYVQSGEDQGRVEGALKVTFEQFKEWYDQMMNDRARVSF